MVSASSLETPSLMFLGAPSTSSLASFKPRLVTSRTALITLILLAPTSLRRTVNSVFSSAGAAPAAPPPPRIRRGALRASSPAVPHPAATSLRLNLPTAASLPCSFLHFSSYEFSCFRYPAPGFQCGKFVFWRQTTPESEPRNPWLRITKSFVARAPSPAQCVKNLLPSSLRPPIPGLSQQQERHHCSDPAEHTDKKLQPTHEGRLC